MAIVVVIVVVVVVVVQGCVVLELKPEVVLVVALGMLVDEQVGGRLQGRLKFCPEAMMQFQW